MASIGISTMALILASASPASAQEIIDDKVNDGEVSVPGDEASPWVVDGSLTVGDEGTGTLTVGNGGVIEQDASFASVIGYAAGSEGSVTVSGTDAGGNASTWNNNNSLTVGRAGTASLVVEGGGVVLSSSGTIASNAGSVGTVTITGTDGNGNASRWLTTSGFSVGRFSGSGKATLNILDGGLLTSDSGSIYGPDGGESVVLVSGVNADGTHSTWNAEGGPIAVGSASRGVLRIEDGGIVRNNAGIIARTAEAASEVVVTGTGSQWINGASVTIGERGEGLLTVADGGRVSANDVDLGADDTAHGVLLVSGVDSAGNASTVDSNGSVSVGDWGSGDMTIEGGGQVIAGNYGYVAANLGTTGTALVTGTDGAGNASTWSMKNGLGVGSQGNGTLTVAAGGLVTTGATVTISGRAVSNGAITVTGSDGAGHASTLEAGELRIASYGTGTLTIADGGAVAVGDDAYIGYYDDSIGTLTIGAAAGEAAVGAGAFNAATLSFRDGDGTIVFNHNDSDYVFATALETRALTSNGPGTHRIDHHAGQTTLTGDSSAFAGTTTVHGGQLAVDGALGGAADVLIGGTLTGGGALTGAVAIADGGTLLGVQGRTLTMDSLTLSDGSLIDVTLGAPGNAVGLFHVTNDLALDGQLNVTASAGYGQGVYRLFDYEGALTDGGLAIAAMPVDTTGQIQTSVAQQVNLVVNAVVTPDPDPEPEPDPGAAPDIQFWNGTTTAANGMVNGGSGVWDEAGTNWTDLNGDRADAWGSRFAVFQTNPEVVTTEGAIATTGMQFIGEGWAVEGSAITLAGADGVTAIRVGDGSGTGVHSATIAAALSGDSMLVKDEGGTLILTGENDYTGGTEIRAGTLQIGDGGTAGSIEGDVANDGVLVFNRSDATGFAGTIGGTGDVAVRSGDVTFTADHDYGGVTTLLSGATLRLGDGGTAGAIAGPVDNDGTLIFNRSDDTAFAGAIGGGGAIRHLGSGTTALTGDSSGFAGTTAIEAGTLAVNGRLGGALEVLAGGRLQGTGTVGDVIVTGTIAPGNSIGTLNVAGNIGFAAGSIYEVEVNAAGEGDLIAATGAATIDGGSVQVLAGTGDYSPQTDYIILTADGGVSGTFTDVSTNLAFLDPALIYGASDVTLRLTRNSISFAGIGHTPNQIAAGAATESLGLGDPVADAVVALSAAQARDAFDQLSGEIHASTRGALIEDSRLVRQAVWGRLRGAAQDDRGGAWGEAIGSWGHGGGNGNAARIDRSTAGLLVGVDGAAQALRFGLIGGYSRLQADVDARASSSKADNYHLGAYVGGQWQHVALRTGLAYSWHNIRTARAIGFGSFSDTARADYDASTFQAFGELGHAFDLDRAAIEPFVNLAYVRVHSDAFAETGGDARLAGGKAASDVTFATLGLRATTGFDLGKTSGTFRFSGGWRHAFGDETPVTAMRYQTGGNGFAVAGLPVARNAAVIDVGLDVAASDRVRVGIGYNGQIGNRLSDHAAKASVSVSF